MKLKTGRSIGWNLEYATMIVTQRIHDGADCYPWHKTFALWPVKTVGGKHIWLKTVYKRKFWAVWGTGFHMEPVVEYGTLFDVLIHGDD